MNKDKFITKSQDYLSKLVSSSSFNLEDRNEFSMIKEPYNLNGTSYQIFPFRKLTGYLPDSEKKDEPVLYTFYLLRAPEEIKKRYLDEVNKMRAEKEYDKNVIGWYYANFVPSFKPFEELTYSLGKMLEEDLFPDKGYQFVFHLATPTKDFDIALVYLQLNSLEALEAKYPNEQELVFNI